MHEDETRTTECAFSIMPRPHARKRTFVTSSAKFQIARHAPGARAPGAHCPYGTDVRRCRQTSRASPGNARAPSYIAGKFLARFVFKKRLLYTFLFMEVVGFGVSNVFAIKQNPKRRTTRAPSPRFPAIFAPIRAPGRRPGDRRAPEPQPRAAAARQNLKSRFTGFFRRPDPAFSSELSRRTRPVIVRDARTRRDKPPTGGRESVRR